MAIQFARGADKLILTTARSLKDLSRRVQEHAAARHPPANRRPQPGSIRESLALLGQGEFTHRARSFPQVPDALSSGDPASVASPT